MFLIEHLLVIASNVVFIAFLDAETSLADTRHPCYQTHHPGRLGVLNTNRTNLKSNLWCFFKNHLLTRSPS